MSMGELYPIVYIELGWDAVLYSLILKAIGVASDTQAGLEQVPAFLV